MGVRAVRGLRWHPDQPAHPRLGLVRGGGGTARARLDAGRRAPPRPRHSRRVRARRRRRAVRGVPVALEPAARVRGGVFHARRHPTVVGELFQGVQVSSRDLPARFLPTWIAISTPPATLLLGALGAGAVLCSLVRRPSGAVANVELRFLLLVLGVLVVGVGAVVAFGARVYDGWRHMFFLHAPVSVLAVFALRTIARSSPPRLARAAQAATAVAALATCAEMAGAHPHQYAWFNFLVDRQTPEALASRYEMDHRSNGCLQGVRHLADNYPQTRWILDKRSGNAFRQRRLLPPAQRKGFAFAGPGAGAGSASKKRANVLVLCGKFLRKQRVATQETPHDPKAVICSRKIHNSTILEVVALDLAPNRESTDAPGC